LDEDVLADIVGRERVLAGKTYVGGVMRNPGHIESGVAGKATHIGELDGRITPRANAIADTFNASGLDTTVSANIVGTMWDKLLVNVATGALTGTTGLTYGQLYDEPLLKATALAAVAEAMAVARAAGVTFHGRSRTRLDARRRRAFAGLQDVDAAKPRERIHHRDRLHQRRGRALGTTAWCADPGQRRWSPASKASSAAWPTGKTGDNRMNGSKAYLEHVAIWVKDIHWHIRFFEDVLGMTMREVDGTVDAPPVLDARRSAIHPRPRPRCPGRPARPSRRDVRRHGSRARRRAKVRRHRDAAGTQLVATA
jgi:hypothetical protein